MLKPQRIFLVSARRAGTHPRSFPREPLWGLHGGRGWLGQQHVGDGEGGKGSLGVYFTAFFRVTFVIKGWKDPWELLERVLLLQNSGKGLLDAGAGKGKGNKDPAKHHILQTWLLWGLETFSSPKLLSFHSCQAGLSRVVVQTSPALWAGLELCGKAETPCQ